jgi:hypothetical protein
MFPWGFSKSPSWWHTLSFSNFMIIFYFHRLVVVAINLVFYHLQTCFFFFWLGWLWLTSSSLINSFSKSTIPTKQDVIIWHLPNNVQSCGNPRKTWPLLVPTPSPKNKYFTLFDDFGDLVDFRSIFPLSSESSLIHWFNFVSEFCSREYECGQWLLVGYTNSIAMLIPSFHPQFFPPIFENIQERWKIRA